MNFNRNITRKQKQKGLTLIELLIAIAIGAALLFGIFKLVDKVQSKRVTSAEATSLNTMIADTRTKFASQGNFVGITPQVLIQNGVVPGTMVNGVNIASGWNTNIAVAAANLNGTAGDSVSFTYQVPRTACSDFVQAAEGAFARVTVGGNAVKDVPAGANNLNVVTLGTECDSGAGGNVAIVFTQGR